MKKKKYIAGLLMVLLLVSLFMTVTYADKIASTHGELNTDGVDVEITATQDEKLIAPNMTVHYEPVIKYKGVDAYVRFKLDISNEDITLYHFKGLSDDWVKRGEYYYYTKPVSHNTILPTFKSFHIPEHFDEEMPEGFMNSKFNITAYADAVQAKNFNPDFNSDAPWGELVIQDNSYDGSSYKDKADSDFDCIRLNFKGASQYSLSSDEMVKKSILPGDTYKNSIVLSNSGERDMEVFFLVDKENTPDVYNLLDALELKISIDGKELYNGSLRAADLNSWKNISYMKIGSEHVLNYEIYAPAELDNNYEEKLNNFTWNFKVREVYEGPKTGDTENLLFWIVLGTISILLLFKVKEGDADEE